MIDLLISKLAFIKGIKNYFLLKTVYLSLGRMICLPMKRKRPKVLLIRNLFFKESDFRLLFIFIF
ncbi:MAG TPA: hypothetical protein DIT10_10770 [Chryseobacterium sp.]|nr:hypothetical protein [Chryseobacterium sp.]